MCIYSTILCFSCESQHSGPACYFTALQPSPYIATHHIHFLRVKHGATSIASQLGYMVFPCGVSKYSVAVFHLMKPALQVQHKLMLLLWSDDCSYGLDPWKHTCKTWRSLCTESISHNTKGKDSNHFKPSSGNYTIMTIITDLCAGWWISGNERHDASATWKQ